MRGAGSVDWNEWLWGGADRVVGVVEKPAAGGACLIVCPSVEWLCGGLQV